MDKSSDSSSDSDSNSSTSWVFVDDTTVPSPTSTNTFHLDCSREPIQELTEQDLLSAGSDFESDTDGISVISESEVPVEDPCLNIQSSCSANEDIAVIGKTNIPDDDRNDSNNTTEKEELLVKGQSDRLTKIIKPLHMLGVGFVLTAVLLACYSRLTTKISEVRVDFSSVDDIPLYDKIKVEDGTTYNKIDVASCDVSNKMHNAKTDLNKDLEEIVDITMTCAFHHKPKSDVVDKQIKKCVKKEYNTKKTENTKNPESLYSEMLESVEHYKKVINFKAKDTAKDINIPKIKIPDDDFAEHIRRKYGKEVEEKNYEKSDDIFCNVKRESYNKKETGSRVEESAKGRSKENVIKLKWSKKKYHSQEQLKHDNKDSANSETHERLSIDQIPTKKPYKYQKDKKHYSDYKDKKRDRKDKKYNYVDKKNYENKHSYKNVNKHQKNIVVTINHKNGNKENKFKEVPNKISKSKEYKYKNKMMQKRYNATTGEWYTNLHKARNQIRKQEHVSDWVFDRAHIRNKKRNKAQWYFKWMNIREQLRYKQSYKPYSS